MERAAYRNERNRALSSANAPRRGGTVTVLVRKVPEGTAASEQVAMEALAG